MGQNRTGKEQLDDSSKKYEGEFIMETREVPQVVKYRKLHLWVRDRQNPNKHSSVFESRILTIDNKHLRSIGKFFVKDLAITNKDIRRVITEEGFKCSFCDKSYKMNELFELEEISEVPADEKFNALCGNCWTGGRRRHET